MLVNGCRLITPFFLFRLVLQQQSTNVMNSFNTEAMKVAALGVTVTVSSGDNGVAGTGCPCNGVCVRVCACVRG